jgi:TIGR01777 family protein
MSDNKTIGITGGTGFVGRHIIRLLEEYGYQSVVFTRHPEKYKKTDKIKYAYWNPDEQKCDLRMMQQLDGVINLAGEGIASERWTNKRKQQIVDSRVRGTEYLVAQLKQYAPHCQVLVSASATGYYGADKGGGSFKEDSAPANDFLGQTCLHWEQAAKTADNTMRTVITRFGIVLGKEAGMYKELATPMNFCIAPTLGSGKQMVSWIHVDDLAGILLKALQDKQMSGAYNAVAPQPATHKQIVKTIANVKAGPKIPIPVPSALLKIALGEMSEEVLKSCTVSSQKMQAAGYSFHYSTIDQAVKAIEQNH